MNVPFTFPRPVYPLRVVPRCLDGHNRNVVRLLHIAHEPTHVAYDLVPNRLRTDLLAAQLFDERRQPGRFVECTQAVLCIFHTVRRDRDYVSGAQRQICRSVRVLPLEIERETQRITRESQLPDGIAAPL